MILGKLHAILQQDDRSKLTEIVLNVETVFFTLNNRMAPRD